MLNLLPSRLVLCNPFPINIAIWLWKNSVNNKSSIFELWWPLLAHHCTNFTLMLLLMVSLYSTDFTRNYQFDELHKTCCGRCFCPDTKRQIVLFDILCIVFMALFFILENDVSFCCRHLTGTSMMFLGYLINWMRYVNHCCQVS